MSEQEIKSLIDETLSGNPRAFEILYNATSQKVWFLCFNFLKNEQDSLDVMQDTYLMAYKNLNQLKNANSFQKWILQIAANKCRNFIKSNRQIPTEDDMLEQYLLEENEFFLPEEYVINNEKRNLIMGIMQNNLSDVQYQTVIMYYFNNMTISEIAGEMDCPEGTVKYRLSVARGKIKEGVLRYEQINDTKLYSFAGVPILTLLLTEEANGYLLSQEVGNSIMNMIYSASVEVAESASYTGVNSAIAKGGKGIMSGIGAKIAVGISAVAVIGGAVAAVIISHKKDDDKKNSNADTEIVTIADDTENTENDTTISDNIITEPVAQGADEEKKDLQDYINMFGYVTEDCRYKNDYYGIEITFDPDVWVLSDWHSWFNEGYEPTIEDFEEMFKTWMHIMAAEAYGRGTDYDYGTIDIMLTDLTCNTMYDGEDVTSDELHEKDFRGQVDYKLSEGSWKEKESVLYIGTISCGNISGWYYTLEYNVSDGLRTRNESIFLYKDNMKILIDIVPSLNILDANTQDFYDRLTLMENRINLTDRIETEVIDSMVEE